MVLQSTIGKQVKRLLLSWYVCYGEQGEALRCVASKGHIVAFSCGTMTLCEHQRRREPVLEVLSRDLLAYRERIDALGEHL
ncbi:MAG: hypothetical protein KatS3mg022_1795 [Armatimonadota bacterium]|nr:MAG: hypothetical protein KatS3mg022_1795 [Armatimonadota bacterium]